MSLAGHWLTHTKGVRERGLKRERERETETETETERQRQTETERDRERVGWGERSCSGDDKARLQHRVFCCSVLVSVLRLPVPAPITRPLPPPPPQRADRGALFQSTQVKRVQLACCKDAS